jgi:hypothetical protein
VNCSVAALVHIGIGLGGGAPIGRRELPWHRIHEQPMSDGGR